MLIWMLQTIEKEILILSISECFLFYINIVSLMQLSLLEIAGAQLILIAKVH